MGWEKWEQQEKLSATILKPTFHILTLTILSLLLPLSFLLLARLSTAQQILTFTPYPTPTSIILSLFLYTKPPLIHSLVLIVSVTTLLQVSTGFTLRPRCNFGWGFLCLFQLCIGLGIEATISAGISHLPVSMGYRTWLSRAFFFIGLYETTVFWTRVFMRPLIDDTIYGSAKEESLIERVAKGAGFTGLWFWRLRNEVEGLGVMVEIKKEVLMGVGTFDFACWLVYYVTVLIGTVRFVKGLVWVVKLLLCREKKEGICSEWEENDKV
ncbi:uncharacterized protein LOC143853407 [Tasmannia lanceolata]|uniref:uncharacterized protein LOC143853407 n=1 Tax=Tasmannia lanceolata TaxID=3420 RepID=UPI0040636BFB